MSDSFRVSYVSLYVSTPSFLHIMTSTMLVLETLVSSKLTSTCLIRTSDIEQYCLCFKSGTSRNYLKCVDYLGLLEPDTAMQWILLTLDPTCQENLDYQ